MGKEEVRKLVACERNGSESWRFRKGIGRKISDIGKEGIIKLVYEWKGSETGDPIYR